MSHDRQHHVEVVRFARETGLPLAVRGGGRGLAGLSACGHGLLTLSLMREVKVDPETRTAVAQPGATWADFDAATQAHGLASTGGLISHTGVAGLTLGGGIGWLMRKHGLAADNLTAAEVVIADGSIVRAGSDEPELLWGLRGGGGGNFGVVSSFEFRLHPVGPTVVGGLMAFSLDRGHGSAGLPRVGGGAPRRVHDDGGGDHGAAGALSCPPSSSAPGSSASPAAGAATWRPDWRRSPRCAS